MDISCAFPPVPETPEHIALAERLGYRRSWVYDTPALQLDEMNQKPHAARDLLLPRLMSGEISV